MFKKQKTIRSLLSFIITGSNSINYDKLIQRFYGLFITIFFSNQEVFLYFYQETILLYCYLYRSFSVLLSRNYSPILLSTQKFFCASIKKLFSYIVIYTEVFLCFYQETILLYCYLYRSFSILLYFSLTFNIYGIHSSHQVIS